MNETNEIIKRLYAEYPATSPKEAASAIRRITKEIESATHERAQGRGFADARSYVIVLEARADFLAQTYGYNVLVERAYENERARRERDRVTYREKERKL